MKVFIGGNGVGAHHINDKAQISHEIEKKTSLSKRSDGTISNKNVREIGGGHTKTVTLIHSSEPTRRLYRSYAVLSWKKKGRGGGGG
ncbi:MAG: hypothetical protein K2O14_07235, partial [Oscillospiraceae bacterium]|nr:hypothetical protein [Oscillospiraceae bacterium]